MSLLYTTITTIIFITYLYYFTILIGSKLIPNWFWKTKYTDNSKKSAKLVFLFATKGGNAKIIKRGVDEIIKAQKLYSYIPIDIYIVTEDYQDSDYFNTYYTNDVQCVLVPNHYITLNNTHLKARGLQYMCEKFESYQDKDNTFIVHMDEESIIESQNIPLLHDAVLSSDADILSGQIYYPLEYNQSHVFSRIMESNRCFIEPECALGMITNYPKQGHGSNIVCRMSTELDVSWDFGEYNGQPFIAEDIFFIIKAQTMGYKTGWHGVPMIEQPAFTVRASIKQRDRWVIGTLQAIDSIRSFDYWKDVNLWSKFNILVILRLRAVLYGVGFLVAFTNAVILFYNIGYYLDTGVIVPINIYAIGGLLLWVVAYQYGVYMNLKFSNYSVIYKIKEHFLALILCWYVAIIETYGAAAAVLKWYVLNKKSVSWTPTPKKLTDKI